MRRILIGALSVLAGAAAAQAGDRLRNVSLRDGFGEPTEEQRVLVGTATWRFDEHKASPYASARRVAGPYKAEVSLYDHSVRILRDGKQVFTFRGHERTVFVVGRDVLTYAVYGISSSGCELVAVDLKTGKELWKTALHGIPVDAHFIYHNLVNLSLAGEDTLRVTGRESFGNYVEFVDRKTGRTVGHLVFPREKEQP